MTGPDTLQTLVRTLSIHGNRPAILAFHEQTVETWSFDNVSDAVASLAAGLAEQGLRKGEYVAICSPNRPEWIIACLALLSAGAIPVPIDSQIASDDLVHVLKDCAARRLITVRSLTDRFPILDSPRHNTVILLDADETDPRSWRRLGRKPMHNGVAVHPEDTALLFYTSGVSGRPKGVPLTHTNLLSNLQALLTLEVYGADERLLLPLPLHHVYPFMIGLLGPLARGLPVILPHSLTGPQILRALRDGHVTTIVGVPRLYSALYDAIEQRVRQRGRAASWAFHGLLRLSTKLAQRFDIQLGLRLFAPLRRQLAPKLRTLVYGGSALDPDLGWRLRGLGWYVAGGFGLTETSPILTLSPPGSRYFDTAGKPLPGVSLRIADADSLTGQGEIQAQGPNIFSGYLHLPDKTREAFTQDGWFRTGDLGYFDNDGCLHLMGRTSSRITLSTGEKVWPEQVEEVLDRAPSVRESAVLSHGGRLVGILVPQAAVVQPGDIEQASRTIRADLDTQMARLPWYSRITDFIVSTDPLPRTRLGKIQRHKLPTLFESGKHGPPPLDSRPISIELMAPEDRQLLEDPVALRTWTWLTGRFPTVRLTPDTTMLLDLGLDSIEWMTMTLELHDQLGVDLPEEAFGRAGTVRDLLREAVEARQTTSAARDPVVQLKTPDRLLDAEQRRWLKERGWILRGLGTALFVLARLFMRTFFSLDLHGAERVPTKGPCLLICNHASLLDPLALIAVLPDGVLKETYWGGWTGIMFRNPIMRLISRATQVLPIDQRGRHLTNLALGAAVLARGKTLVWFPEGGRTPDGTLQPFQAGIGLLVTAQPWPVIPICIEGSFHALPPGAWWPHRGTLRIAVGEAIEPDRLARHETGTARYRLIAAALREHVAALEGQPAQVRRVTADSAP
jgi:long-chain acyl-CoA synthetase